MGFTWYGAVIGGFLAIFFLARRFRMPLLLMLDMVSVAAALGYGIGRIGCLISGDGDYGIPTSLPWGMSFPNGIDPTIERVHPTPIYEFLMAVAIFWILWRLGARVLKTHAPDGIVFAVYLMLTGIARFLVEFIRRNPQSYFHHHLTNAQVVSAASIFAGIILFVLVRPSSAPRRP
jgi:phosphatidylglycerol:prolipoprotein diacylglycerol transferase